VRQTRCWSLPASASVVGCKTPWEAAWVRSSSLWVPSGRIERASDSAHSMLRACPEAAGFGRWFPGDSALRRSRPRSRAGGMADSRRGCALPNRVGSRSELVRNGGNIDSGRWCVSKLGQVLALSRRASDQVLGGCREADHGPNPGLEAPSVRVASRPPALAVLRVAGDPAHES
jgi:hypothetical protein